MRHLLMLGVFVAVFALGGTTALANTNNDNRVGRVPFDDGTRTGVPCHGLYQAGVGNPPGSGGATVDKPGQGFAHVFENDEEMCHQEQFVP